jgi:hypothetical protein
MPVIVEPFKPGFFVDPTTKEVALIQQPKISMFVKVHGQLYPYKIEAFVDSGATRNLFPTDILTDLHISVASGQKKLHHGIGGIAVTSYTHEAEILIGGFRIQTAIDFGLDHKPPLLGMEQFFDFFDSVDFNMERSQL